MLRTEVLLMTFLAAAAPGCNSNRGDSRPASARHTQTNAKQAAGPQRTAADTFVFAIAGEPETLDPAMIRGMIGVQIAINLVEGLVEYPLGNGRVVPALATRWEVSEDGRSYTFHLTKEGWWSNGEAITAEDFKWSWLRVLDPKTGSPNADKLFLIKGARDFHTGKAKREAVGLEAVDKHTFRVHLEHAAPYFLEVIAFPCFRPVHRKSVEARPDHWTRPELYVTSGPFQLAERSSKRIVLRKSLRYRQADRVKLEKVRVLPIQDNSTMVNLYRAGDLDWSGHVDLPALQLKALERDVGYHEDAFSGVYFYQINIERKPFDKVALRGALGLAIDRRAIVKVLRGGLIAAGTMVPRMPGYARPGGVFDFDPDLARAKLAEAGFPGGKGLEEVKLLYNTNENHKRVAEMVQQMWQAHLGVKVELINQEWKVYLKTTHAKDYAVARAGWVGIYMDPTAFLERWQSGHGMNDTGWGSSEYDGLLTRARSEADPKARLQLLRGAESVLLEEAPVLPIYHYAEPYLLNPEVKGFKANLLGLHPMKHVSK